MSLTHHLNFCFWFYAKNVQHVCLAGCLVLLSVLFVCIISYLELTMGQSMSTPLSLTLDHWAEVHDRASNQSVEIEKKKWQILCTSEWPTFNMGWLRDGTFNVTTNLQIK